MFIWQRRAAKVSLLIITTGWRQSHNIKIRHSDFNKPAVFLQKTGCVLSQWLLNPTFLSEVWLETPTRLRRQRWAHETQTHNDMLRISLVSGLHTPRSSCSKLEMRATPDPAKIKIDSGGKKWGQKSLCLVWLLLSGFGFSPPFPTWTPAGPHYCRKEKGARPEQPFIYIFLFSTSG